MTRKPESIREPGFREVGAEESIPRHRAENYGVHLLVLNPPDHRCVQITDLFGAGLRLCADSQMEPGQEIVVILRCQILEGQICDCVANEIGQFHIDVRISSLRDRPPGPA